MEIEKTHSLEIINRKTMVIKGIKTIDSFDNKEFLIETLLGYLHIKGINLTLDKMDTTGGEIIIKGDIDSLSYVSASSKEKEGFFKRILK